MTGADWRQEDGALVRDLRFRDFDSAFRFVGSIARGCVDYLRRPDMTISEFNHVRLSISNPHHAGITNAELRLAAKVDAVVAWTFPVVPPHA
ncbi:MAG: 4a-hydroxytetrahydrobiopterin dehydratase [Conexibacter sp.]|jgi:pterin-4a-carbinolamine dehydratase|nr:4a-hydroxytetrahydrobiopterin dehydratase [Conexibacter sp.]